MSVESSDCSAGHPLSSVLGRVVVMNHQRVTNDGGVSRQGQVRIRKEHFGGAEVQDLASYVQVSQLGSEVAHPAAQWFLVFLAVLIHTENNKFKLFHSREKK